MAIRAAILGTGNIGTDLLKKTISRGRELEIALFSGIDPASDGIARAKRLGVPTSSDGIEAILSDPSIRMVFDATSAAAHRRHAPLLRAAGKFAVDMTPAAVGPYYVPAVDPNLERLQTDNVNMVTCGGQGTIPIVMAISRVTEVLYAETVSTIASVSAGPGTRANIDEFTVTTARAVAETGRAGRAKAIIILNPAEPPIVSQNTIYAELAEEAEPAPIVRSIEEMVARVRSYVPGYRLKYEPIFDGRRVTVIVEVEGAGDYLPKYAGNLDIMTSAALAAGEAAARKMSLSEKG
ncbi:acetaldehyde dehydrogenase (acetylating) [Paenibacillus koleovorans]|uniref:acetaldehyde dehydrogenase (acetylating) n=1 Tax=Paenibacillus koleovorans TaxID=121608 RepID=UPI000FD94C8E|nr:acetaldehyde dehydrogenase (acetylating) [Paenibacillus koleovorans]